MGLTVHYSGGKAKSQNKIKECINFLKDTAERLPCQYLLVDEALTGTLDDWRHPKNPNSGKLVTIHQKGIMIFLDEGSEPLTFTFDNNTLEFCNHFFSYKSNILNELPRRKQRGINCREQA